MTNHQEVIHVQEFSVSRCHCHQASHRAIHTSDSPHARRPQHRPCSFPGVAVLHSTSVVTAPNNRSIVLIRRNDVAAVCSVNGRHADIGVTDASTGGTGTGADDVGRVVTSRGSYQ